MIVGTWNLENLFRPGSDAGPSDEQAYDAKLTELARVIGELAPDVLAVQEHMDMTAIWVAEHGWCYLNAIIDCCTREIVGWGLEVRCRAVEAIAVVEQAVAEQGIAPGTLTLGTDNGSAFTARRFRAVLSGLGVRHRRGGYRDPESQAFIESWFSKLKQRCVWRHEFETLDQAREVIAAHIDRYHDRPHQGLDYRTPSEVRQTWDDAQEPLQKAAA